MKIQRKEECKLKKEKNIQIDTDVSAKKEKSPRSITLVTTAVVIAVLLANIAFSIIGDSLLWYIDMTAVRYKSGEAAMYTLSDECKSLIGTDAVPMIEKANIEREKRGEEPIKLNIIFCAFWIITTAITHIG